MAFELSIKFGKSTKESPQTSQVITPLGSSGTGPTTIQTWGGSSFYPIDGLFAAQNNAALISMYNDIPDIQIPVNAILDALSRVPIHHYIKRGGEWKRVENSKVETLLKNPNQYDEYDDYVKRYHLDEIVLGNLYLNPIKPFGFGRFTKLYIIPAETMKPLLQDEQNGDFRENEVVGYEWNVQPQKKTLSADAIVHRKNVSKGKKAQYIGTSRLNSAINVSLSLRYNYEVRVKLYKHGGALGMLTPSTDSVSLSQPEAELIQNTLMNKYGLTEGQSPNIITPKALKYQKMGIDAKQLDLNNIKIQDFQTVCGVLQVPSITVNDNSTSTFNNMVQADKRFWRNAIIPRAMGFASTHTTALKLPANEKLVPDFSHVEALQADKKLLAEVNSILWNDSQLTRNEYREAVNYEAMEGEENDQLPPINIGGKTNEQAD